MSNPEYWAFMILWNIIIIGLAIGFYCQNKGWEPPRWLTTPWEHLVRIMEKPFRRKKPVHEPAGIIHYGQFEITIGNTHYEGIGKSNGYYDLYIDGGYYASYPQHLLMKRIIDHAKENK